MGASRRRLVARARRGRRPGGRGRRLGGRGRVVGDRAPRVCRPRRPARRGSRTGGRPSWRSRWSSSLATALAVGLVPALRLSRPEVIGSLKDDVGTGGRRAGRFHRVAVSAQVGVALLFVAVSGVFVAVAVAAGPARPRLRPAAAARRLARSVHAGVRRSRARARVRRSRAGLRRGAARRPRRRRRRRSSDRPRRELHVGQSRGQPGRRSRRRADRVHARRPRLLRDRRDAAAPRAGIEEGDTASSPPVVVITRRLAERLWPGEEALGRQLRMRIPREAGAPHTVVGVVTEVASSRPTENWPQVFVPLSQHYDRPRASCCWSGDRADAAALTHSIQSAVRRSTPASRSRRP